MPPDCRKNESPRRESPVTRFSFQATSLALASVQMPGNCARVASGSAVITSDEYAIASAQFFS